MKQASTAAVHAYSHMSSDCQITITAANTFWITLQAIITMRPTWLTVRLRSAVATAACLVASSACLHSDMQSCLFVPPACMYSRSVQSSSLKTIAAAVLDKQGSACMACSAEDGITERHSRCTQCSQAACCPSFSCLFCGPQKTPAQKVAARDQRVRSLNLQG